MSLLNRNGAIALFNFICVALCVALIIAIVSVPKTVKDATSADNDVCQFADYRWSNKSNTLTVYVTASLCSESPRLVAHTYSDCQRASLHCAANQSEQACWRERFAPDTAPFNCTVFEAPACTNWLPGPIGVQNKPNETRRMLVLALVAVCLLFLPSLVYVSYFIQKKKQRAPIAAA